ncbi:MAG: phage Gp19/Gp15/Gp42 family protein [Clostridiales Family XIII bacterium]|jgi:hypothetical protein|nr:phage Gp19/Gp15/Gp42 family protein [Clostridiales Family XIII bacterium]
MTPYATVDDVEARYGPLSAQDAQRAGVLLQDAAALILAVGGTPAENLDGDAEAAYKAVCCAMVHRVMISPAWAVGGVTQHSQTAGPFSESYSFGNPNGDLYLTKAERRQLGMSGARVSTIAPARMPEPPQGGSAA